MDGGKRINRRFYKWRVCHKCDNKKCCRPSHLFRGTDLDNARDKENKGRGNQAKGEDAGGTKITQAIADRIRSLFNDGYSSPILSKEFGLTANSISLIVKNKRWITSCSDAGHHL